MKVLGDFLKARHTHTLSHRRGSEGAGSSTGATGAGLGLLQQYIRQRASFGAGSSQGATDAEHLHPDELRLSWR
jgi:hypothetical protein